MDSEKIFSPESRDQAIARIKSLLKQHLINLQNADYSTDKGLQLAAGFVYGFNVSLKVVQKLDPPALTEIAKLEEEFPSWTEAVRKERKAKLLTFIEEGKDEHL